MKQNRHTWKDSEIWNLIGLVEEPRFRITLLGKVDKTQVCVSLRVATVS